MALFGCLGGCDTGEAKVTAGYRLPAKYVIHTVGPMGVNKGALTSCYRNCLKIMEDLKLTSIAFPCISTGKMGDEGRFCSGPERGWDTRNFFPGPTATGGPMGAHRE